MRLGPADPGRASSAVGPARNGPGRSGAVVGVLCLLGLVLKTPLVLVGSVVGLWLSIVGYRRVRAGQADNPSEAITGLVSSGVGVLLFLGLAVLGVLGSLGLFGG